MMRKYKANSKMLYLGADSDRVKRGTIVTIVSVEEAPTSFPYEILFTDRGELETMYAPEKNIYPIPDVLGMKTL